MKKDRVWCGKVTGEETNGSLTSRMLVWMTPAGFEQFLFAVGQPARLGEQAPGVVGGTVGALTGRRVEDAQVVHLAAVPGRGMRLCVRATVVWHPR